MGVRVAASRLLGDQRSPALGLSGDACALEHGHA
eukprot:CAMPEP_0173321716 /NCGR_PEP_ID=MMETSP1143-20121109/29565_1 /TAXON_ID=483371 /ORGANISM="non described non described, Strain CCMP2298" /LENGTH=33 /DNA_ID= /DNA_START= /DNA_END= /DNA_ORIENTATION=